MEKSFGGLFGQCGHAERAPPEPYWLAIALLFLALYFGVLRGSEF